MKPGRRPFISIRRFLALLVVAMTTGACVPESVHSLPEDIRVAADEVLIGTWQGRSLGTQFKAVVSKRDEFVLDVVFTDTTRQEGAPPMVQENRLALHFFNVAGRRVMAVRGPGIDPQTGPVWRFATYRLSGRRGVVLFFLNERVIYNAVHASFYRGLIRNRDPAFRDILLREPPARLAAIFRKRASGRLFSVTFGPFRRQ